MPTQLSFFLCSLSLYCFHPYWVECNTVPTPTIQLSVDPTDEGLAFSSFKCTSKGIPQATCTSDRLAMRSRASETPPQRRLDNSLVEELKKALHCIVEGTQRDKHAKAAQRARSADRAQSFWTLSLGSPSVSPELVHQSVHQLRSCLESECPRDLIEVLLHRTDGLNNWPHD